jgi:predicted permease
MSLWRQITGGLRVLINRAAADRDLEDERRHFLDEAIAEQIARGLEPEAARRAAEREIGSAVTVREHVRDRGWEQAVTSLVADLRLAGRMLRKSPLFTAVVVIVIALGSGAVSTVFSAMNAILLRPLPAVGDPARLVALRPARADGMHAEQGSYSQYTYLRDRAATVTTAAWGRVALTIATGGPGNPVLGNMVSANYFEVLAVRPALGRFFSRHEDVTPGAHPVLVVSHRFWQTHLGAEPAVIGRAVHVNGHAFTLVGVAPPSFRGLYTSLAIDAWVPLAMQPVLRPRTNLTSASWLWFFGRLRDDIAAPAAQSELAALMAARAADLGIATRPWAQTSMHVASLNGFPGGEGKRMFGFLGMLLAAAGVVLVIAGVNVASMLSARYTARRRELAVRAALGAGRLRLLRQLLTEILVLFAGGAIGGVVVAQLATSAFERMPLPPGIPISLELSPDLRVFAFALVTALAAGAAFGLAPALQAARRDITSRLRDGSDASGVTRTLIGRTLVAGQLALSLVLILAAGLFARALERGARVDRGFDVESVTTATFEPESWGYDQARAKAYYRTLTEQVSAVPGVTAVAYISRLPLMLGSSVDDITVDGAIVPLHYASVDAGYFDVVRIPLLQGRPFTPSDNAAAGPVTIVNETLARRIAPGGDAVGRTITFRDVVTTIVGVARDAKYGHLDETTPSFAYFPFDQIWHPTRALLVRTSLDPAAVSGPLQRAIADIDPLLPKPRLTALGDATAVVLFPQRTAAIVTGALGLIGLVLSSVGLYGVMSFSASRRTREVGIRIALGAGRPAVVRMMLGEGLRLAAIGLALGVLLSIAVTRLLVSWLLGVSPLDPIAFGGVAAIFAAVALVASYLPARRAASADPIEALRETSG